MKKLKKRTSKPKNRKSKALGAVQNEDRMGTGMAILSYIIPPVGIYQYFAHQDDRPKRAKIGGGLALLGLASGLVYKMTSSK